MKTILKPLKKENGNWNGWKFQIHWNKLEWVDPKSHNVNIDHFFTSSHKFYIKDKDMTCNWVGNSKMKPIDADELFNRKEIINELESSLNKNDQTEESVVT